MFECKTMLAPLALAALLPLAACNAPAAKAPVVDKASIAAAIKAGEAAWVTDWKAKDPAKVAARYADDAVLVEPFSAPVNGQAAILARETESFKDPAFNLTFAPDRVEVADAGDLAWSTGQFQITMTDPASKKPVTSAGAYVTVWKKQADGSWKAAADIATPGPAPAPAPKS